MIEFKCPLHEAGEVSKDGEGLICPEGTLSFYEYNQLVSLTADRLLRAGILSGERVGLLISPGWRGPVLLLALIRMGATVCPLDPSLDKADLTARLKQIPVGKLILSETLRSEWMTRNLEVLSAESLARMGRIDERIDVREKIPGERCCTVLFNPRSGGESKAVLNTYANHYYSALGCNTNFDLRSHDKWMLTMPLSEPEGIGIVFRTIVSAGTLVIPGPDETLEEALEEYGITHISLGPVETEALFDGSKKISDTLRLIVVNGEVGSETLDRASKRNVRICTSYSLSEMASVVTAVQKNSGPDKRGTRGEALKYRDVSVDSEGRIRVRGKTLFSGYLKDGKIHRELTEDGWFETAHFGVLDSDGYLTLKDRENSKSSSRDR